VGQKPIRGVHERHAAVLIGNTVNLDAVPGKLAHDIGRLVVGPLVIQILEPGHCALPEI